MDITDPAIVAAATLSHRYITDRQLPDKAIDLVDEAGSHIRMEIDSKPESMDRLERRIIQLKIERAALHERSRRRIEEATGRPIETQLAELEVEFADLDEIWKAEKAAVQGATHIKEELERARIGAGNRAPCAGSAAHVGTAIRSDPATRATSSRRRQHLSRTTISCCVTASPRKKSPTSYRNGPASRSPRCSKASAKNCCAWSRRATRARHRTR